MAGLAKYFVANNNFSIVNVLWSWLQLPTLRIQYWLILLMSFLNTETYALCKSLFKSDLNICTGTGK